MSLSQRRELVARIHYLVRKVAQRLEQHIPCVAIAIVHARDQRFIHKSTVQIDEYGTLDPVIGGDRERGVNVPAVDKNREPRKELLLLPLEQVVAPLDEGIERLMACWRKT